MSVLKCFSPNQKCIIIIMIIICSSNMIGNSHICMNNVVAGFIIFISINIIIIILCSYYF